MTNPLSKLVAARHWKTHAFAAGMTLAMAAPMLQQGCPLAGQCATCGACAVRAPLLALPFVVDAAIVFGDRLRRRAAGDPADSPEPESAP